MNIKQSAAVNETEHNSIILACPGSGKTFTLISKIIYLINIKKVDPKRIILLTYTKKTAIELNERLKKFIPEKSLLYIGTMHGLSLKTIQTFNSATVKAKVIDDEEANTLIESVSHDEKINKYLNAIIEQLTYSYPINLSAVLDNMKLSCYSDSVTKTLAAYDKIKNETNVIDFGDIMIRFIHFLQSNSENAIVFKKSYDYIFFDEYQDINSVQDLILKEMNSVCNNLTVVGDDAQAIYRFRGSSVKFIQEFNTVYPDVKQFILNSNYRSCPEIVDFCNDLISHNNDQIKRIMISEKENSELKPYIHGFSTLDEEANFIIRRVIQNKKYSEQVILSRTNRQLDLFELLLLRNKIPYIKGKGTSIVERDHVLDYICFISVSINNNSDWSRLFRLLNLNSSGTGTIIIPNNLLTVIEKAAVLIRNREYDDLSTLFITNILKPNKTEISKITEDIRLITSYLAEIGNPVKFSDALFLNSTYETDNKLLLSTIHGSKGLEWETVYLIGCSSDLMPYIRHNEFDKQLIDIEEERRLFYVGCTRAKCMLFITLSYDFHRFTNNLSPLIYATPFINDICKTKYYGIDLRFPMKKLGDTKTVVHHYLTLKGSKEIHTSLKTIKYDYKNWFTPFVCNDKIYGEFMNSLTVKMVKKDTDWIKFIPNIIKRVCTDTELVINDEHMAFYKKVESMIRTITANATNITIGLRLQNENGAKTKVDIVADRTLIKIDSSNECTATIKNILQMIICRQLLRRVNMRIDKCVLLNPLLGESYTFVIPKEVWKDVYNKIMR